MPDILLAIATTLATKGAEAVAAGGKNAIAGLIGIIRRRLATSGGRATALDRAVTHPADREARMMLITDLAEMMATDRQFAAQVLAQWRAVCAEEAAERGLVVNHVSGTAHKVLQARDVHGDISL